MVRFSEFKHVITYNTTKVVLLVKFSYVSVVGMYWIFLYCQSRRSSISQSFQIDLVTILGQSWPGKLQD